MFDCFEYWANRNQTIWEDINGNLCWINWYDETQPLNGFCSDLKNKAF